MTGQTALEAVLPELGEPGVPGVGIQSQLQVVVVEGLDHRGLKLHGDAALGFLLVALNHLVAVSPPVAVSRPRKTFCSSIYVALNIQYEPILKKK